MATTLLDTSHATYFDGVKQRGQAFTSAAVFDFSHLDDHVRKHLMRVYVLLLFTVAAASLGSAVAGSFLPLVSGAGVQVVLFLASLGIIVALGFSRSTPANAFSRSSLLVAFGFLQGVLLAPLIASVSRIDPWIPLKAFVLTAVVFACFSLAALVSAERKFLYLYGILTSCLLGLVVISLLQLFVRSPLLENVWLFGGLVVFSLFVAVDTQIIVERALRGDSDSVHSALDLFLDALNIFIRVMMLLSRNKRSEGN